MIITAKMIDDRGACPTYMKRLRRLFPTGVRVTQAVCVRYANEFDWDWAVTHLVPGRSTVNRRAFDALVRSEYDAWCDAVINGTQRDKQRTGREYVRARARTFAQLVQRPDLREIGEPNFVRVTYSPWDGMYPYGEVGLP